MTSCGTDFHLTCRGIPADPQVSCSFCFLSCRHVSGFARVHGNYGRCLFVDPRLVASEIV